MELKAINPTALGARVQTRQSSEATRRAAETVVSTPPIRRELTGELANKILQQSGIKAADIHRFQVKLDIDDGTGRVVAEVRNKETDELVQEVPSRVLLRQAAMLEEALGMILDRPV